MNATSEAHLCRAKASLQFQPIRRPQASQQQQRNKPKTTGSSAHKFSSSTVSASAAFSGADKTVISSTPVQQPHARTTNFSDWVGDNDEDFQYQEKRERGGKRSKNKKKRAKGEPTRIWDWDDIYDPTQPSVYADYKGSEEQMREVRDWKARLYYHKRKEEAKRSKSGSEAPPSRKPANSASTHICSMKSADRHVGMFAPPPSLSFAPPSFDDAPQIQAAYDDDEEYYPPPVATSLRDEDDEYEPPSAFAQHSTISPPAEFSKPMVFSRPSVPAEDAADDLASRRVVMSDPPPLMAQPQPVISAPPAPISEEEAAEKAAELAVKKAEAAAKIAAFKAKMAAHKAKADAQPVIAAVPISQAPEAVTTSSVPMLPVQPASPPKDIDGTSISRAPVLYKAPPPTFEAGLTAPPAQQDQPRNNRPGQKGFAERLLKKYGWEKGQGLGATGDGITTAIIAQAEKRGKKRSDFEGKGWGAQPANMGKIVGGKRRKVEGVADDDGLHGAMSEVVKLQGMLTGLDIEYEMREGNLMQEIGEEMEKQYGKVERMYIWRKEEDGEGGDDSVFVKFTSQLSALRAVSATDGMTFAGNEVRARYFDTAKFEGGEYV